MRRYRIAAIYDTETANVGDGDNTRAYQVCYMFNDVRRVDIAAYEPDKDDSVTFLRSDAEALEYIEWLIQWGSVSNLIPIVCAYNLMFDLQPLMCGLNSRYSIKVNAQSSTNVYTLDLMDEGETVLRFWDTFHLEMRGLKAMGDTCGLAKANGDWDYSLVRTPETPLSDDEIFYATRDVQVIPAYLRYLLEANEWMKPDDLGVSVLTKTSIVRQMAKNKIGAMKIVNSHGHKVTLLHAFETTCKQQLPKTYEQYALRKACFRGGLTFTSANLAMKVVSNVASLDVTSMHHTFINGRYVPIDFRKVRPSILQRLAESVCSKSISDVLGRYHKPFLCAFHARIRFENLRLRKGSCFERWGIATISQAKFKAEPSKGVGYGYNERAIEAERMTRTAGWYDRAFRAVFAFGKLMSAETAWLHLSELELWVISQVYQWDSMQVILGEATRKYKIPPDYVTLQSNVLFETKNDAKKINKRYIEGEPYTEPIPDTIPKGIAAKLKDGTCSARFFESYYNSTVKGSFNGIYGTMAQDIYKPDYMCKDGELMVDRDTTITKATFTNDDKKHVRVMYNYGLRIVGGSRMHMVIAMQLLYERFGAKVDIMGGDTDSIKIRCDDGIGAHELLEALQPLHIASTEAISYTMKRVRRIFPQYASSLSGIGCFECENEGDFYVKHMEAWNKARVSLDARNHAHITCAGLSRPDNAYHIEHFIDDLIASGNEFDDIAPLVLGFNVYVSHDICHSLQKHQPKAAERFEGYVTDYLGNSVFVDVPQAISLYPAGRWLGESDKSANRDCISWLDSIGRNTDTRKRYLEVIDGHASISIETEWGIISVS